MGYEQGEIGRLQVRPFQQVQAELGHRPHGDLEGLVAPHFDVGQPPINRFTAVGWETAAAAWHRDEIRQGAVGLPVDVEDALPRLARLQQDRPRAVAEENTGLAVGPVRVPRQTFGADDQHVPRRSRRDELAGDVESINEAGTRGRDVETDGVDDAELRLRQGGRRRNRLFGSRRRDEHHVDLFRIDPGILQGGGSRPDDQIDQGLVLGDDASLLDARPGGDPLVTGVDHLFQVAVGQNLFGKKTSDARDTGGRSKNVMH